MNIIYTNRFRYTYPIKTSNKFSVVTEVVNSQYLTLALSEGGSRENMKNYLRKGFEPTNCNWRDSDLQASYSLEPRYHYYVSVFY